MERIFSNQFRGRALAFAASFMLGLTGCGSGGDDDGTTSPVVNNPPPTVPAPAPNPTPVLPPEPPPAPPEPVMTLFPTVTDAEWDETAVRKVLVTFAYGGQTSDAQIEAWAEMAPDVAITEMFTFDEHNFKLSVPSAVDSDRLWDKDGTLRGLSDFWLSSHPDNFMQGDLRERFRAARYAWTYATLGRGLNPFRQKIGYWETNFHLVANIDTSVQTHQVFRYYDEIMSELEQRKPYQQVLSTAASSAAIAMQYGHRFNRWVNDECECNEDFAREFHQLFFGILGSNDQEYHETVTIKNSALAFTDMKVQWYADIQVLDDVVTFGAANHTPGQLAMLGTSIGGTNARERIALMSEAAIRNTESLDNLPIRIISGLADDNLTAEKTAAIRTAWASMPQKELLAFLRSYAISKMFHDGDRIKFLNSVDRHMFLHNMMSTNNEELYLSLYDPMAYERDGTAVFSPEHNVFGGQTGLQAADSPDVFRNRYNSVTEQYARLRAVNATTIQGIDYFWEKDWAATIPRNAEGMFEVSAVAEWLWQRFVADGLKNYGTLERAHIHSLLATKLDLSELISPEDLARVFTSDELASDPELAALIDELGEQTLFLDDAVEHVRRDANRRIGQVVNFIAGTPFMFAQEGR